MRLLLRLTPEGWALDMALESGAIANSSGVSPHLLGANLVQAQEFFERVLRHTIPSAFGFDPEVHWRPGPDPDTWWGVVRPQAGPRGR